MNKPIHLVLFSNDLNDQKTGISNFIKALQQILSREPDLQLTIIETDHSGISAVKYRKNNNTFIISVPGPENKTQLNAVHSLLQITYARRVADVLYADLQGKQNVIFWANAVDYMWLFQALKEHHPHAVIMYMHHQWSWKQYLNVPDETFWELWISGDITLSPRAFELTAYEQKMAMIAGKLITVSEQASRFFSEVLQISTGKIICIGNGDVDKKATAFLNALFP